MTFQELYEENQALKAQRTEARIEKRKVVNGLAAEIDRLGAALELALRPENDFYQC